MLAACLSVLGAFYAHLERLQVSGFYADPLRVFCFSSCWCADLVKVSGCNRRGSCARLPVSVCRFVSVSGSGSSAGSADPLRLLYYCISGAL